MPVLPDAPRLTPTASWVGEARRAGEQLAGAEARGTTDECHYCGRVLESRCPVAMGLILTDARQAAKGAHKETAGPAAACVPRRSRPRGQDLHGACGTCKELF